MSACKLNDNNRVPGPPITMIMADALQILVSLPQLFSALVKLCSELNYCPIGRPKRAFIIVFE